MKKWILIGVGLMGMLSVSAFNRIATFPVSKNISNENEITAIINKKTTQKELDDLKAFLAENDIELIIKKINFNKEGLITAINIVIQKGSSKSHYSSSSNQPIPDIELGYKNGNLYITSTGMFDIASFRNQSHTGIPAKKIDSLLKQHNLSFDFNFDNEDGGFPFGNGAIDIQQLKDQIMQSMQFKEGDMEAFFNGQAMHPFQQPHQGPKYRFRDDPSVEKLIIINGKESNFKTLDTYAKEDKLEDVDFLKPATAISIYGDKAKDGAIIATLKK
ncbi:hypothetical protein ACFSTE_14725 [Aquimarina hainanensis]|uniref:Uncharacterized protein n=1 Tax=Aquimarina hainanensis TaxID=1578017 RepID=A0ABW5N9J7_9FLAO